MAILDDYAGSALDLADWTPVQIRSEVTVFDRHLSEAEAVDALRPFDVICTVRERMALPRTLIEQLPNLKLITIIGKSLPNLDMAAASERGILVAHSNFASPRLQRGPRCHSGTRLGVDDRDGAQSGRRAPAHAGRRVADDHGYDVVR